MAKILPKFGEQQLVMVNYACGFNQSETGKYFEWIIVNDIFCGSSNKELYGEKLQYNENLIVPNTFAYPLDLSYIEVPLYFRWFLLVKKFPWGILSYKTVMYKRCFLVSYLTRSSWIVTYFCNSLTSIWNTKMNAIDKEKSISLRLTDRWSAHVSLACAADELNLGIKLSAGNAG